MRKTIIGTGIFNLDTIVVRDYPAWPALRPFVDKEVLEEVGGTCGNVMSMLAWMGWDAKPVARLDDSAEGIKITEGLKSFGCDCRYVTNTPEGGTTLLRCTHKKDAEGNHVMSVRAGSPGGSRFPKRHFLRARDEAVEFLAALGKNETPSVFFFDDPAAGNRVLAKGMRDRGALVYFEPSRVSTNPDLEAVRVSDIVKFSDENVPDVSFVDAFPDKVFIQTMGAKGLRIKYKKQPWHVIDNTVPDYGKVVDTEGAGDWLTAAFLNELFLLGVKSFKSLNHSLAITAAAHAMYTAAKSVRYLGSKGMIHAMPPMNIEGAEDCPWCIPIMRDAAQRLMLFWKGSRLDELDMNLRVVDWDHKRIYLCKQSRRENEKLQDDYTIRTWDSSKQGIVRWTLFRTVPDEDPGVSHGEEIWADISDCFRELGL